MEPKLKFSISNQRIYRDDNFHVVAGSKNYLKALFEFKTPEWDGKTKTAVFYADKPYSVVLVNDTCDVPWEFTAEPGDKYISVFAGDLITVNKAIVKVWESGYIEGETPKEPTPTVYEQIIALLESKADGMSYSENILKLLSGEKELARVTITGGEGGAGREIELQKGETAIQWRYSGDTEWIDLVPLADITGPSGTAGQDGAQGPKGDTGADGKSAYQYAQEGGYTGTETEFAEKMAQEKFANPNALTFTGSVSATYDGSAPVSVEIPSGVGGSAGTSGQWEYIGEFTESNQPTFESGKYRFFYAEAFFTADAVSGSVYRYLCIDGYNYCRWAFGNVTNRKMKMFVAHGLCSLFYASDGTTYPVKTDRGNAVLHKADTQTVSAGTAFWVSTDTTNYPIATFGIKLWGAK